VDRVAEAMLAVPRRDYLPPAQQENASFDGPISIGHGATNSQPTTVRNMLRLLDPEPGQRVLDIGAGSGWTTGLLAWLVDTTGTVIGVERIPELVTAARACLGDRFPQARVHQATPGVLGRPEEAPYDRILVSAAADRFPDDLVEQLRIGGVLVVPVGGLMLRAVRTTEGTEVTEHGHYRFVPLVED
jgi:protein-L-isoaspartate(D-aspartate) O-methyltransferase